ncbi:alpha/beta hydrolase [Phyllobacterium sp. YR531]|uniref:alpha/beta hydrolase n=1 Tax=Phyllobacterium sp. YR531 TaxID=1144343 RepID=UPI00026FA1A0|nr:alpha/beta hydrolase [Phyllobacterium sp. YR531]EJN00553.1 esterase/lipase [Phyllobacterium sp. YR531]
MRSIVTVSVVIAAALAFAACSPARILNMATSANGADVQKNIAYGEGPRRTLDVYAPSGARNAPVAVFFYGGSWQSGEKQTYQFVASAFAAKGIVTIVPDYRLSPEVHYQGFLRDGAMAVKWARNHAKQYGGDPSKLFLVGHSAGAYIAAMLALDDEWLDREGLSPARDLKGFVGISGPYNFLPSDDKKIADIFATEKSSGASQPINYAGGRNPPVLLLHGTGDNTVYPRNSTGLGDELRAAGSSVEVKLYPGVGHLGIIGAMGSPARFIAPTLKDTTDFILGQPNG